MSDPHIALGEHYFQATLTTSSENAFHLIMVPFLNWRIRWVDAVHFHGQTAELGCITLHGRELLPGTPAY